MELQEFIKQSLLDITKAVYDAKEVSSLSIAPGYLNDIQQNDPRDVTFEVAVTVAKDAGGKISVLSIGDLGGSFSSSEVSRITFSVPVFYQAKPSRSTEDKA